MSTQDFARLEADVARLREKLQLLRAELASRSATDAPAGAATPWRSGIVAAAAHHEQSLGGSLARVQQLVRECEGLALGTLAAETNRLRADLARIHGSRWWRIGSTYWALQRRVDRALKRLRLD